MEIHGAHGYLISQFLGAESNRRGDAWGGTLEKRARFLREVVRASRAATGPGFLIGVRFSPEISDLGITLADSLVVAQMLVADGVDFLHSSNWDSFQPPAADPESDRRITAHVRAAIDAAMPLIATGGVWTRDEAEQVLADGADFVGFARAAIGNPRWPIHVAEDPSWEPLRPPYSEAQLRERALSPSFVEYMKRWPGFVAEDA